MPKNSYLLFKRNIFPQDFLEEFYQIVIPYDNGNKTEKIYSFENKIGDEEYLVLKLSDSLSAGSKQFRFLNIRNGAAISLTTNFGLKLFDLTSMSLDETLGSTPTLLTTGGIKHIDNYPVDIEFHLHLVLYLQIFIIQVFLQYIQI